MKRKDGGRDIGGNKCPFCRARTITISGFDFECGSSQYVNGINRSSICYENQLSQQAQEIENKNEIIEQLIVDHHDNYKERHWQREIIEDSRRYEEKLRQQMTKRTREIESLKSQIFDLNMQINSLLHDPEIERLRKELSLYKAVWDEVRMADRAQILEYTEAGREFKGWQAMVSAREKLSRPGA